MLNESQKDSTMKIDEPKTPYVRNPPSDSEEGEGPSSCQLTFTNRYTRAYYLFRTIAYWVQWRKNSPAK